MDMKSFKMLTEKLLEECISLRNCSNVYSCQIAYILNSCSYQFNEAYTKLNTLFEMIDDWFKEK